MKKVLFMISVAAVTFASCSNESTEFVGDNSPKEIAFMPVNQKATRAAVQGTTFPTANTMEVAAYMSQVSEGTPGNYFSKTTFKKDTSEDLWRAWSESSNSYTPIYWPLNVSTLNFFAISGSGVSASDITIDDNLGTASVAYTTTSYSQTTQSDIMYAFGRGSVAKSGSSLTFGTDGKVSMAFSHALALVNFQVKGVNAGIGGITINSITLHGASFNGTLGITNANATTPATTVTTNLDWTSVTAAEDYTLTLNHILTADFYPADNGTWAAVMIIPSDQTGNTPTPRGFTTFTINYTFGGHTYNYTYAPSGYTSDNPNLTSVAAGHKYTYTISMELHEIKIDPSVTTWTAETPVAVPNI